MAEPTHRFRVRFLVAGSHVHCNLYSCKPPSETWQCLGNFTVSRGKEFQDLVIRLDAEFVSNDPLHGIVAACAISSTDLLE